MKWGDVVDTLAAILAIILGIASVLLVAFVAISPCLFAYLIAAMLLK
jgi:hypothetical protein